MNTTELITPPAAVRPTFGEMIAEIIPLVGAVAGYGPPVIAVAGPWLFLALLLAAPFAVLLTVIAAMLVATTVVVALAAAILAILTAPSRLMRHGRARRAFSNNRAPQLVAVGPPRVAS
jgi:hypothetical protein